MKTSLKFSVLLVSLLSMMHPTSHALSPTDNYRQHIEERRTGELAYVKEGVSLDELRTILQAEEKALAKSLKKQKASNLSVFAFKDVNGKTILLAHRYDPVTGQPSKLAWPEALRDKLVAHEHAGRQRDGETTFLDMELICHLPCAVDKKPEGDIQRVGLVTELLPDMEKEYRTLHQTVWPGVIDQIARSNYRHWTTWCTEINGKIYLLAYFEYVGSDLDADNAYMAEDPTTIRWWKHTDACQKALPGQEGGPWAGLELLLHID